jgi:MoxR-like ATPase
LTRRQDGATSDAAVPDFVKQYVSWGAGPRASQYLILGAKARAILHGRPYAGIEDVQSVAAPVLRHRILTNFNAEAEGLRPDDIVNKLIDLIPPTGIVSRVLPKVFKTV